MLSSASSHATPTTAARPEIGLQFTVRLPNGKIETLLVDATSALIGSGAHCEVRLPAADAAHEHVEVIASHDGVFFAARGDAAPPLLGEDVVVSGLWLVGTTLTITRCHVTLVGVVDLTPSRRTRSPFWALTPVPVLAAVVTIMAARSAPAAEAVVPPAPPLLDAVVAACPNPPSPTLAAFAAERARVGLAKRERGPFSPSDSVEAVAILETAASCYQVAGQPEASRETALVAAALRAKLEEEYHVRRVRIEHAFRVGDPFGAKRELSVLLPMLSHRRGAYIDWLGSVDRYATSAIDQRSTRRL